MLNQSSCFRMICIAFICISGFSAGSITSQESVVTTDQTLYEIGQKYYRNGEFEKSRLAFQTLINTYPDSNLAPHCFFVIAGAYYHEGGAENRLKALESYKDFIDCFSKDRVVRLARIAMAKFQLGFWVKEPDIDRESLLETEQACRQFLEQYPGVSFNSAVRQVLNRIQEKLNKEEEIEEFWDFAPDGTLAHYLSR